MGHSMSNGSMRRRWLLWVTVCALGSAIPRVALPGPLFLFYKFNKVAEAGTFPYSSVGAIPVINGSGRVAFTARLSSGFEGVFTRLGNGGVNTLIDSGVTDFESFGGVLSINALNVVLFSSLKVHTDFVESVFFRGQGNSATQLISDQGSGFERFCGGELSNDGSSVFGAQRTNNGRHVVLTAGSGSLTGPVKVVAEEGSEFSSLGCEVSINQQHTIAFVARRLGGNLKLFTRAADGQLTQVAEDGTGSFTGFSSVALNNAGAVAFVSNTPQFGRGVYRIANNVLTKIGTNVEAGTNNLGGVSINDSGRVAFNAFYGANGAAVFVGENGNLKRVAGPGTAMFGQPITQALIMRGSLNNVSQIVMGAGLLSPQFIVRADPVRWFDDLIVNPVNVVALSTGDGPSPSTVSTQSLTFLNRNVLDLEVRFLNRGSTLSVQLGDRVVKAIDANKIGVRQRLRVPLDFQASTTDPSASTTKTPRTAVLTLALKGPAGSIVHLEHVSIPGVLPDAVCSDAFAIHLRPPSTADHGSFAGVIDATRYPVKIVLWPGNSSASKRPLKPGIQRIPVAVLSYDAFDATTDIDRATLNLNGTMVRSSRDAKGTEAPACQAKDVNADKEADLVCEFELVFIDDLTLEAQTSHGWGVRGVATIGVGNQVSGAQDQGR